MQIQKGKNDLISAEDGGLDVLFSAVSQLLSDLGEVTVLLSVTQSSCLEMVTKTMRGCKNILSSSGENNAVIFFIVKREGGSDETLLTFQAYSHSLWIYLKLQNCILGV